MGHHEDMLADGGTAVPAVGQVEQAAADHVGADGRPRGAQVVGTGGGCVEDQAGVGAGDLDVSVVIPVEQRADLVVGVGDEAVERHGSLSDHLSHPGTFLSWACSSGLYVFYRGVREGGVPGS